MKATEREREGEDKVMNDRAKFFISCLELCLSKFCIVLNTLNSLIEEIDILSCCFLLCQKLSDYTKVFVFS